MYEFISVYVFESEIEKERAVNTQCITIMNMFTKWQ